jgi:V-type H+-transporting ATPase subunit C
MLTSSITQTGTLSSLLNLSDAMPKYDSYFTQTVSKLLDTIRSLVADDKQKLQSYATVGALADSEPFHPAHPLHDRSELD